MGRRPIKKRVARKAKKIRTKSVPPIFGAEEAKIFDIPKPPAGLAYQWVLAEHLRKYPGWVSVPFARHSSEIPADTNEDGSIVYLGNVLVQRAEELVKAELSIPQKLALKNLQEHPAYRAPGERYSPFPVLSESFMVSREYAVVPADSPPIDVDITIKFRVSRRWQDAAAALGLDAQEYARRRLLMEDMVLASYGDQTDRFYLPVELYITRKDS